jgi:multiple sugar transport system permease protein
MASMTTSASQTASAEPGARAVSLASMGRRLRRSLSSRALVPYLLLAPFLTLFVCFFFAPLFYAFSQSFYRVQRSGLGFGPPEIVWAGADNYFKALRDPEFLDGIRRVILFGLVQIPVMMILALIIALLMDSTVIRFRRFFRLAAFVPYAIPGVVAVIMWGFFYSPGFSPIVQIFKMAHVPPPDFLGPGMILYSIGNISTWEFMGYNMIIFFSALQAIPQEIYESGRLDGLTEVGVALRLKLPLIRPALLLGLLFSLIGTLQLFNEPQILSRLSGSITSHFTPNIFAYNIAFVQNNYYYGGALAVILGLITFVFSFGFLRLTRGRSGG